MPNITMHGITHNQYHRVMVTSTLYTLQVTNNMLLDDDDDDDAASGNVEAVVARVG